MNRPRHRRGSGDRALRAGLLLALGAGLWAPGCMNYRAYRARFMEPDYLVTRAYFTNAPRHVAILPFAARSGRDRDTRNAQVTRAAFYQHLVLRSFDKAELRAVDRVLAGSEHAEIRTRLQKFTDALRRLDFVGMTSLLDLPVIFQQHEDLYREHYRKLVDSIVRDKLNADSYVLGISRSYGRIYLVVFSSIALSTRLELRSVSNDILLWRAQAQRRNTAIPLTLNPLNIPFLLVDIWKNSRGKALDLLAYQVYGDVAVTIPEIEGPAEPFVEAALRRTPVFHAPSVWRWRRSGWVAGGARFPMQLEKRGWFQCEGARGEPIWIFRRDGKLVDREGNPILGR